MLLTAEAYEMKFQKLHQCHLVLARVENAFSPILFAAWAEGTEDANDWLAEGRGVPPK